MKNHIVPKKDYTTYTKPNKSTYNKPLARSPARPEKIVAPYYFPRDCIRIHLYIHLSMLSYFLDARASESRVYRDGGANLVF